MIANNTVKIAVIGSINLDIVATAQTLPAPGETVGGATLASYPGGKGANQAVAAQKLGAAVAMVGRVGRDAHASEALVLLRENGVDLSGVSVDSAASTGVALIAVDAHGENQIIVAPGANAGLLPDTIPAIESDAFILQLETPIETVAHVMQSAKGFIAINLAPAIPVPDIVFARADLIIVNEGEAAFYGDRLHQSDAKIAITYGAKGAAIFQNGEEVARAAAPSITPVDTTGAGDTFVGALVVALMEGQSDGAALRFACAAGACSAMRAGAQASFPVRGDVEPFLDE
jgi:ribokinase